MESMQRVCTLEAELALLLRISYKYRKSGAQGSHHRFETKFGRELSVDVDKQRMVSNKVVRGVLEFIRGHALLFDQILREDLSGADELTMEQVNLVVIILTKMDGMSESEFNQALNIELKHIIEVLSL
nr:nuclear pore complex protein NUP205 [Ipomoea batatas]